MTRRTICAHFFFFLEPLIHSLSSSQSFVGRRTWCCLYVHALSVLKGVALTYTSLARPTYHHPRAARAWSLLWAIAQTRHDTHSKGAGPRRSPWSVSPIFARRLLIFVQWCTTTPPGDQTKRPFQNWNCGTRMSHMRFNHRG
jgi:hypothetical protein